MARYEKKKDFGLGKPTAQEKATAQKMANMAKGKPSARNNASTPNKLSAAMYTWAKTNMSKLKSPTAAQKKIFEKYKAMVKAGDNPANPKPKAKPTKQASSTSKSTPKKKPVQQNKTKPIQKPAKQEEKKPATTTESKTAAGRRNIERQVAEASGSSRYRQRQLEARRRRARQRAAQRNLMEMFARKYREE